MLVQSLEECTKMPETQQRIRDCFLSLMPQMKTLYLAYCANHHPRSVFSQSTVRSCESSWR